MIEKKDENGLGKSLGDMTFAELVDKSLMDIHNALMMGGNQAMRMMLEEYMQKAIDWHLINTKK